MNVKEAIETRRAYRALVPVEITDALIEDLASAARLAPSCFNNQPWRFVFARDPDVLTRLHAALPETNAWATAGSMIIGVASRKDLDCDINGREYFLFGAGLATAFLVLRATELGLVAHPIAGYGHRAAKEALGVPQDMTLIALVIIGHHDPDATALMTDSQIEAEPERPERKPLSEIAFTDRYGG
jgi:nitroreductase